MIDHGQAAADECRPPTHDCRNGYINIWEQAWQVDRGLYFTELVQVYYRALWVAEHTR
jgi:hypothetical protein